MMKDIYQTHKDLKEKKVSASELVQESIKKAKESHNNTFISLTDDLAIQSAKNVDNDINKEGVVSYLQGIPFSLKDLFITKGIRTTAGSKILYNYIPPFDGYVSKSLSKQKGILIGKVSCDQFGMGGSNENTPFGTVKNPLNKDYVTGGSSGGSAASVVEGSSFYSIGTDTGGSVRQPANFCGLTGFKPTYGRISRFGQIAFASSLDQTSPIAKNVLDQAIIMEALTEKDPLDSTNVPLGKMNIVNDILKTTPKDLKGKTLGFSKELIDGCDDDIKKSLDEALESFKKQGVNLKEISLPHSKYCVSVYYIIATSEASTNLARFDGIHYGYRDESKSLGLESTYRDSRSGGFGDEVKRRILLGTFSLSSGYQDEYFTKACKVRRLIHQDFMKAFDDVDIIFFPVCASNAFKIGEKVDDPLKMYLNDLYTIPVSLAGLPGLALPFGKGKNKLPTGFQLIGRPFGDEELLKFGRAFELGVL